LPYFSDGKESLGICYTQPTQKSRSEGENGVSEDVSKVSNWEMTSPEVKELYVRREKKKTGKKYRIKLRHLRLLLGNKKRKPIETRRH